MPKDRRVSSSSFDRSMVCPYSCSSKISNCKNSKSSSPHVGDEKEWEEVRCPICIEHPHNAVLLFCSSREKGCRPFVCDSSYRHSNCFDQFRKSFAAANLHTMIEKEQSELVCPFCRGTVTGWDTRHPARKFMNSKIRSCSLETCSFSGNYEELRKHARLEHPSKRPSEANPTRQTNWTMLEQAREIDDALLYQSDIEYFDRWPGLNELLDDDFWSEGSFFDFPSGMSDVEDEVIEEMLSGLSTSCFSLYSSSHSSFHVDEIMDMMDSGISRSLDDGPYYFSHDDDMMDSGNSRSRDRPQRATILGSRPNSPVGNAAPSYHSEDDANVQRSRPGYQRETDSLNIRSRSGYHGENGSTISSSRSSYRRDDGPSSLRTRENGSNAPRSRSRYYRENEMAPESSRTRSSYHREDEQQPNSRSGSRFDSRVRAYATRSFPSPMRQTRSEPGRRGE